MSWNTISTADVLSELTASEKATLENVLGATNTLADILGRSVNKFRGAIRAGGQTVDASDGTIPDDIRDDVIAHARWRLLTSIPQAKTMQTAERKAAYEEALKTLEALRKPGAFNVENPTDDATDPTPSPSFGERGGSRTEDPPARDFTRDNQEGS